VLAAAVAIVVAIAAALLVRPALETSPGASYRNDPIGWTVTIPPGWQRILFKVNGQVSRPPVADLVGVLNAQVFIANGAASSMDGRRLTSTRELADVPPGGVLVSIAPSGPARVADAAGDDYAYPLAPSFADTTGDDAPDTHLVRFQADGIPYTVTATFGAGASDADRRAAEAIAASIVVPAAPVPATGTAVARVPGPTTNDMWRLGPSERFPAGTVKRVRVEPIPFGGFQPRVLFIVTPARPVDGQTRWMFTGSVFPCRDLRWNGHLFSCGQRTWRPNGEPVGHLGTRLPRFLVLETWEGQLIASTQQPGNGG
jgi:hypothetical protein